MDDWVASWVSINRLDHCSSRWVSATGSARPPSLKRNCGRSAITLARTLRAIFDDHEQPFAQIAPPAARILSHRAGIELRLRGHVTTGERGRGHFVVLVEQVETEAFYRLRMRYRYGLTHRETEMLMLLRHGPSVARVATALGISTPTAKTYVSHLIEKVGVEN